MIRKNLFYMAWASLALLVASCSGNTDEESVKPAEKKLVLSADKTEIAADGVDAATFTVKLDGVNVTSSAVITCDGEELEGATFSTEVAGQYTFKATLDGITSNSATVKAVASTPVGPVPTFDRHVCVFEFTGQWCANCPDGFQMLYFSLMSEYSSYRDFTHLIALHDNSGGQDDLAGEMQATQLEMLHDFKLEGYPSCVVDLRDGVMLTQGNTSLLEGAVERSLNEYPATCGVAVKSTCTDGKIDITARVTPSVDGDYRLAIFVVEDRIVGKQTDGGLVRDDYTHRHVARRMLSKSYRGDALGQMTAGVEVVREFTTEAAAEWNLENCEIYAVAIDAEGRVNNVSVCHLNGGDTDYDYAE